MKAIKPLENFIKRNYCKNFLSRRMISQFFRPLMTDGLTLTKGLLTLLAKSILTPLGSSAGI